MAKQAYDPASIEPKWQAFWEREQVFRVPNPGDPGFEPAKPKFYVLDMFPYPSGTGLHVGHPEGYTATDIVARYKRMCGFNVLHPMGWDAFGLPAEQHAVQTGTHPRTTTRKNIDNFRRQLKRLGFCYDWSRELSTTDPDYVRWTQWIFARLYERGLAYQSEMPVWWCEALGTVLANEEVINGRSERGDHPCERRPLKQWMLRITSYAEQLLDDLEDLDWPESVKAMQREWIGRSEGAEIDFAVEGHDAAIRVFTTRPDTLFGASFMVLAPEHPLVLEIASDAQRATVETYREEASRKSELDRTDLAKETTGVWTGAYARNPLFAADDPRGRLPVWIADYVILTYGTGAIMAVPAGDERDFRFAGKFDLPVPPIFAPETGDAEIDAAVAAGQRCHPEPAPYINSANDEGLDLAGHDRATATTAVIRWLAERGAGEGKVTYRLRDWLFSRQRYWGEPFPLLHCEGGGVELLPDDALPLELPEIEDYRPSGSPEGALARADDWVQTRDSAGRPARRETNTMPQWAGSCWYYLRFADPRNAERLIGERAEDYWMPVDLYVGGTEHAVLHLLYARFWHKVLFDLGAVSTREPFQKLFNQGMILSYAFKDQRGAVVPADLAEEDGDGHRHRETGEPLERAVAKMSKSLRNVVNPDEVIDELGSDTLRLYEMYMGPLADPKPWNPKDVPGVHRFLHRTWRLIVPEHAEDGAAYATFAENQAAKPELERALQRTIHKVGGDIQRMAFNTAISAMMVFVNEATKARDALTRDQALRFVAVLAPFAPHLAEELWERLGGEGRLADTAWPPVDESMLSDDRVKMAVQVNGKVRGRIEVPADAGEADVLGIARGEVAASLRDKTIVKEIVVKGRLVNFVVR
ncbi:MAG: leucine--tRNA ligase [Planctomycetota bacterium]